jgi:hypothetical protein
MYQALKHTCQAYPSKMKCRPKSSQTEEDFSCTAASTQIHTERALVLHIDCYFLQLQYIVFPKNRPERYFICFAQIERPLVEGTPFSRRSQFSPAHAHHES